MAIRSEIRHQWLFLRDFGVPAVAKEPVRNWLAWNVWPRTPEGRWRLPSLLCGLLGHRYAEFGICRRCGLS